MQKDFHEDIEIQIMTDNHTYLKIIKGQKLANDI